jgi:DNA gyrase subunit A
MSTTKTQDIIPVDIQDEMESCYLDYAMSVIIGRALPDVRDGLKPVHRRSLFAMKELSNYHNKPHVKSARVVGDVIGKYHPHGNDAVYNTIVRMAQEFSLRYPLVDGQGNFGSIDGLPPAAMRYTEVRMQKLCEEILQDLDKETVDWQPNYDGREQEPTVLPTKIPNLLVNGSTGIAVGMATNIPPHNLGEVTRALIALLENPDITIDGLMEYIPGPDFPTAGLICGKQGIKSAYHTGKGTLRLRAKTEIVARPKGGQRIVVTELPYQVNKSTLIGKIKQLHSDKIVTGMSRIEDYSNNRGKASIRICIDLKKDEFAEVILNQLFKHTQLQISYGINFLAISNGAPKLLNLKEILQCFLDHRREVVIRRTIYLLKKAKERAHLLEGLKIAVENIDDIVTLIKGAENATIAKAELVSRYSLSEVQAQAILDLKLQRLTGLEQEKILSDYQEILETIQELETLLSSEERIKQAIEAEFTEILAAYGDERRSQLVADAREISIEDVTEKEETIVTITHRGYLKRMPVDTYKTQKRGGTGVKGAASQDDDFYTDIFTANTHDTLMFFTSTGRLYTRKVYEIPEGTRTSKGRNIANVLPIKPSEEIRDILVRPRDIENKFLVFCTRKGLIKKSELYYYEKVRQSGMQAIKLIEGDNIINVGVTSGDQDIFIAASSGKTIRFSEADAPPKGRVSQGSRGIALVGSERVIGMQIISGPGEILSVTQKGYGKRSDVDEWRTQSRGGKGVLGMRLTPRNGDISAIKFVQGSDDLMIITDNGQVIRTQMEEIPVLGRATQGVRIIKLREDEKVVAIENILDEEGGGDGEE